jgi:hypothetical protein
MGVGQASSIGIDVSRQDACLGIGWGGIEIIGRTGGKMYRSEV